MHENVRGTKSGAMAMAESLGSRIIKKPLYIHVQSKLDLNQHAYVPLSMVADPPGSIRPWQSQSIAFIACVEKVFFK